MVESIVITVSVVVFSLYPRVLIERREVMLQDISNSLSYEIDYEIENKGVLLEDVLTDLVYNLGEVGAITNNRADVEFLLSIVGSYTIAKKEGKLDDNVKTPAELFNENLFPIIDNDEAYKEKIEEGPKDEE